MDNYVGKRLDGRYEILDIIGVGGMAVVYKAYDSIDDRIVAVKILKDEFLANEEFRRRFKNESKAIAILSHPNIVKVYDVSFGDRLQYIVMEYIEGITLKEYIDKQKCIEWQQALYFVIQILRALQHAHDKGIVHRDIKPQNIMLLENGTIKVTDFGIARFSRSETRTMTEKAIGSVHYISPEQAKGEVTDEKADIYSVGVVLYEMLTGKLPFEADSAVSVALMQLQNEPTPPRALNPDIPIGFEQITIKAMQKNPRDRYQTAAEMLLDLEELKRNPNIKFDYRNYFTDTEPTKFIDSAGVKAADARRSAIDTTPVPKVRTANVPEVEEAQKKLAAANDGKPLSVVNDVAVKKNDNKALPILIGIVAALVVFAGIVFAILLHNGTISIGGLGSKKIAVDNFVGKNYEEIIADSSYKEKYNFEPVFVPFSDAPEGSVYKQEPNAGESVTKGSTIKLYIVKSGEGQVIPSFTGKGYKEVADKLDSMGFDVILVPEVSSDVNVGEVIRTDPGEGETILTGSAVRVYYAIDGSTGELFKMPELEGKSLNEAISIINEKGLTLSKKESADSTVSKDYVLMQSPASGSPVRKGDSVILTISTGVITGEKSITLPKTGGIIEVKVTVDGEVTDTSSVDTSRTNVYNLVVKGASARSEVKVYLDDLLYMEMIASFSKEPVKFSEIREHSLNFYMDVTGLKEKDAVAALNEAGYKNIRIEYTKSTYEEGVVLNQSPSYSSAPHIDKTATIVLTVSTGLVEPSQTEHQANPEQDG